MILRNVALCAVAVLCVQAFAPTARAASVDGAWASAPDACNKVFVRGKNRISFAKDADLHGSGFIVDGKRIRGKIANCTVKVRKEDGDVVHLGAACSTDVAVETVQFSFKRDGDDKVTRIFPGLPELETPFFRCRL